MAYTDIMKSAIKFICGDKTVCRLCLATAEPDAISIHDLIAINTPYYNDTLTYLSIFQQLGVSTDLALPQVLCRKCATLTANSILLPRLCEYSEQQWLASLCSLSKIITQSVSLSTRAVSAYFIVGENNSTMLTCYNPMPEKNQQNVLAKFKKSMSLRLKSLKEKKEIQVKFPCPSCPKIFLKSYELQYHKELVHDPKRLQCDLCTKMFSTEKQLYRHKKLYHIGLPCKLCGLELPSKHSLKLHMDKHFKNSCTRCNKQFVSQSSYKLHLKVCGQKMNKFICDLCGKVYAQKHGLTLHLKCTHNFGTNLLSCKWCGKKYETKSQLSGHIVKHTRERKFNCEICGGKFVTNPALVYHMRLHTGERPYACDICDERFLSASSRLLHKRRAHLGPAKECDICQAKFITNFELKRHKRWHDNPHSKLFVPKITPNEL